MAALHARSRNAIFTNHTKSGKKTSATSSSFYAYALARYAFMSAQIHAIPPESPEKRNKI